MKETAVLRFGFALVEGRSMEPTLRAGDRLLVDYRGRPRPGSICLVRLPGRPLSVKRLVRPVGTGWWIGSDNPAAGVSSATVGPLTQDDVVAVVRLRVWPLDRRRSVPSDTSGGYGLG
jgi:signal peptidase I